MNPHLITFPKLSKPTPDASQFCHPPLLSTVSLCGVGKQKANAPRLLGK